jgi:DNA-binding CsgD family transcriptional regulator
VSRSGAATSQRALLEREAELGRLAAAIDHAAAGHGSVVHLEGPAGIGKTGLLDAARELAAAHGLAVHSTRGGELERDFAFGIVRGLFERRLTDAGEAERAELLAGSAALGAPAIGLESGASPSQEEAGAAVVHGLYWLSANLASKQPLLLAVDDVHWADRASLRFVVYLAARVEDLPIVLVTAARPREPGADHALIDQLAAASGPDLIQPEALSAAATERVLYERLGPEVAPEFVAACHEVTGGNPFLLRELAGALGADGLRGAASEAELIRDLSPHTVSRSLLLRLTAMPPAAGAIAAAVAVLGNDVELHHAAGFAGVEIGEAALAVDSLADAEIFAPQLPLNFVHPIVRSAVYLDLGPGERAASHAHAARLLADSGARPEAVAPHVIHSAPAGERRFVELMRAAAAAALDRGTPETAAIYLRRAREEDEAARADGELLCQLGTAEYLAGEEPELAIAHLREGIPLLADPERRSAAWLSLARAKLSYVDVPAAVAVLEEAVEDLAGCEGEWLTRLEVELNCIGVTHADSFERAAARIEAIPEIDGESAPERLLLCNQAYRQALAGTDVERTLELCRRALAGGRLIAEEGTESSAVNQVLYAMYLADVTDEALVHVDAGVARAVSLGSGWGFVASSGVRGAINYLAGDLVAAEADCRQALELPGCPPFAVPFVSAFLALTLVERGELDEADSVIEAAGCGPQLPPIIHMELLLWARARLRAAQGRDSDALADLLDYRDRCERVGAHLPGIPWRGDLALVHSRLGDDQQARSVAADGLRRATAWGTSSALGQAQLVQGLVLGGEGMEALREAVELLGSSSAKLEHSRALVELGAALRRAGQRVEARERLREGLEAARRCAATALADRAYQELVTAGARPRRLMFSGVESLTASESRVAAMAAEGMGNREIAQSLFVTVKTVENHLGRSYAKLGIHSREELPAALAGKTGD